MYGMYAVNFKKERKNKLLLSRKRRQRSQHLACKACHDGRRAIMWIADKDVVQNVNMRQFSVLNEGSPCKDGTMINKPMPLRTHVEARTGAVIQTNVAVRSVRSICGASYLDTFIDGASGHARDFRMKLNRGAAQLLKRQVCWIEQ